MRWHEFIFSEKKRHKWLRHIVFWITWWIYFLLSYYLFQLFPGILFQSHQDIFSAIVPNLPIKTLLLVLLYSVPCYTLIYLFLPQILNGKWLKAILCMLSIFLFLLIISYFTYWDIFPMEIPTNKTFYLGLRLGILNFT